MKRETRKIVWRIFLMYAAVNIFNYALAHVAYLFKNDVIGEIFEYISYYTSLALDFLAPPMLATVMLVLCARESTRKAFGHMLLISTARIFYTLPNYYVTFIYKYRYDSVESLLVSLIASVLIILLSSLISLGCLKIALYMLKRKVRKSGSKSAPTLPELVQMTATNDFLNTAGFSLTVFAVLSFIFHIVKELVDTVSFFVEYRSDYTMTEIATILTNYVLLFLLLIAAYRLCVRLKNRLAKYEIIVSEASGDKKNRKKDEKRKARVAGKTDRVSKNTKQNDK